jgi:hypothetical protein
MPVQPDKKATHKSGATPRHHHLHSKTAQCPGARTTPVHHQIMDVQVLQEGKVPEQRAML